MSLLDKLKEILVSKPRDILLKKYVNQQFSRYGEIMDLQIDATKKTIQLSIMPKGENENIDITATYKLKDDDGSLNLTISKVKTSREWITLLAEEFLPYTYEGLPNVAKALL